MGHEGMFFWVNTFFVKSAIRSQKVCKETFFVVSRRKEQCVLLKEYGLMEWRQQVDRDFGGTVVLGGVEYDYYLPF